jgi:Apea-like HEPN
MRVLKMGGVSLISEKREVSLVPLQKVLDRLGFYHDILAGRPSETVWARIEAALQSRPIKVKTLFELLGCDFPDKFRIGVYRVVRMSRKKRRALGSRGHVLLASLYPDPLFDRPFANESWYLEKTETIEASVISPDETMPWTREQILDEVWLPLLILGLCHSGSFNISEVLESKPSWAVEVAPVLSVHSDDSDWWRYQSPERDSDRWPQWADEFYGIPNSDWGEFKSFLKLITQALVVATKSKSWDKEALYLTARWYLRGRLIEHPDLHEDEYNDVLIHYVTCLENLVMLPGEKDAIADKLACRGAWLIARNDDERADIYDFIKGIYGARSRTVHRPAKSKGKDKPKADFQKLRDVCRRAMACAVIVAGKVAKKDYLDDFLKRLPISQEAQRLAQDTAKEIGSLTRCL